MYRAPVGLNRRVFAAGASVLRNCTVKAVCNVVEWVLIYKCTWDCPIAVSGCGVYVVWFWKCPIKRNVCDLAGLCDAAAAQREEQPGDGLSHRTSTKPGTAGECRTAGKCLSHPIQPLIVVVTCRMSVRNLWLPQQHCCWWHTPAVPLADSMAAAQTQSCCGTVSLQIPMEFDCMHNVNSLPQAAAMVLCVASLPLQLPNTISASSGSWQMCAQSLAGMTWLFDSYNDSWV